LRAIANVMKQSGCDVPDWMLSLKKQRSDQAPARRADIDTTPYYDKMKQQRKQHSIENSKNKKLTGNTSLLEE